MRWTRCSAWPSRRPWGRGAPRRGKRPFLLLGRRSEALDPYAAQHVRRLAVPDTDDLVAEGERLLDLLVDLWSRVGQAPELAVDAQEDLLRLARERLDDVDEGVGHAGRERLGLDLLHHGLRELLDLLFLLVLLLLRLSEALLLLPEPLLRLPQLLEELLVGLLLAELLELFQGTGTALLLIRRRARELLSLLLTLLSHLSHLRGDAHTGVTFP